MPGLKDRGFIPQIGEIGTDYYPWSTSRHKHSGRTRATKHTPITSISLGNGYEIALPTERDLKLPKQLCFLYFVIQTD